MSKPLACFHEKTGAILTWLRHFLGLFSLTYFKTAQIKAVNKIKGENINNLDTINLPGRNFRWSVNVHTKTARRDLVIHAIHPFTNIGILRWGYNRCKASWNPLSPFLKFTQTCILFSYSCSWSSFHLSQSLLVWPFGLYYMKSAQI